MKSAGGLSFIVSILIGVTAVARDANAAACPIDSKQTLSGQIALATDSGDGGWIALSPGNVSPCSVEALQGKGSVPNGCGTEGQFFGKQFTATGIVREGINGPVLDVTAMQCGGG